MLTFAPIVDKTAGSLAWLRAEVPNCISHYVIHYLVLTIRKQMPIFSLKNVFDEAIKILILLTLDLWVHVFLIFHYDEIDGCIKHFSYISKDDDLSWTSHIFHRVLFLFFLNDWQTWLFSLWFGRCLLEDEQSELACHFKKNNVYVQPMIRWAFKRNSNF